VLACLLPCVALAQTPRWPTPQEIDRTLKATPFPSTDRIGSQPVPLPPQIVPQRDPVDIEAIARGKLRLPTGNGASWAAPALRIFITLDMPPASLRLLVDQAARSGAVLVLRGLKGESLRETLAVVRPLIGERHVAWLIDPEAFTRFGVQHAPTFVLALNDDAPADAQPNCISGCVAPPAFVSVAGDVSLDYALEAMMRRRPEAMPHIEPILKRLRAL
jgi:conjugal transfer pilus assembly protein TrbC